MTASGALSHRTVMLIGLFFLLGACFLAFPLIELRGWPILAIGIPSLYFTYGYTGGPWPLAYKGLGEIFVILFFGLVAVLGTILVQIGTAPVVPGTLVESLAVYNAGIVTGIQCGLLCAVMISVNNIRDRKEDLTTGKRTLAVRLGGRKGARHGPVFHPGCLHHAAHIQPGPSPEPVPYVVDVDTLHPLRRVSDAPNPQNARGQPHEQGTGTLLPPFAPVSGYLHNSSHTLKNA